MANREALVRHPVAIAGALIATACAAAFIVLVIAVVAGMFENPYAGMEKLDFASKEPSLADAFKRVMNVEFGGGNGG